jgi:hypothetical protein
MKSIWKISLSPLPSYLHHSIHNTLWTDFQDIQLLLYRFRPSWVSVWTSIVCQAIWVYKQQQQQQQQQQNKYNNNNNNNKKQGETKERKNIKLYKLVK